MIHEYEIFTTVDITNTGIKHTKSDWSLERAQQSNLDTLIQTISLRAQPYSINVKWYEDIPLHFGLTGTDSAKIWYLRFYVESADVFGRNCELFLNDVHLVPIIPGLTETEPVFPPVFMSHGSLKNINIIKCS